MALRLVPDVGTACDWRDVFRRDLIEQYRKLEVPPPDCVHNLVDGPELPELLMFFAAEPWNPVGQAADFVEALGRYAEVTQHLLPVLDDATHAGSHLPEVLRRFNAFLRAIHGENWPQALVDEVLALVWQRRRQRQIFISYNRSESVAIARQLAERYQRLSFNVFHDERSIAAGEDFPDAIRRGLDDSDAVLLLVSPGLTESPWVRKEIQLAVTRRIGLLGIVWPANGQIDPIDSVAALQGWPDLCLRLEPTVLTDSSERVLSEPELAEVDRLLFTGRSAAIAGHVRDLIPNALAALPDFTVTGWRNDGDLELSRDGERWVGWVVPFRPDLIELQSWWEKLRAGPPIPAGIVVLYPGFDARDPHQMAFRMICDHWGGSVTPPLVVRPVHV